MTRLEIAIKAAVDAGELLMNNYGKIHETKNKESLRDIVSEVDRLSENKVVSLLQEFDPNSCILTEESGMIGNVSSEMWIVDALDGTVNYIHNVPLFCVSISYWVDGVPQIGVIYNPYAKEVYYAENGKGCFLNQRKLSTEKIDISMGISSMAFSGRAYNPSKRSCEFQIFGDLNDISQGCLRTGSAAMNLAYIANGKFSLAIGKANKLWDVAAGMVIAKEAGASLDYNITDEDNFLVDYICSTSVSKDELREKIDITYLDL